MVYTNTEAGEASQTHWRFTGRDWESGQRMFYVDAFWRGGDCASSVDLGDGRILWLFADSYIAVKPPYKRDRCCVTMISNCLGIQKGYNPSTAEFKVYWRGTSEVPSAYFPPDDTSWYWPGNAVKIDSFLLVFLMHICPTDTGLGFMECEDLPHAVYKIGGLKETPENWSITRLMLSRNRFNIMLGAATFIEQPYLYTFGISIKGERLIYLARWRSDSLLAGLTEEIEWWTGGSTGWVPELELTTEPTAIFSSGATEFSIIHDAKTNQYLAIQTVGFGATDVVLRTASALTGPWSDLHLIYEPTEKSKGDVLIYAAKAHPEIVGADIIVTYNTNGPIEMIITDSTIYYPRFVRLNWRD